MPSCDFRLLNGDCTEQMRTLADASVDAIVTDPPYEIAFLGLGWDASGIAYSVALWRECLRVLKPGGYLLAFGSPRTYHRMTCAIEDAGFEIRDSIHWIYSNGFPKGIDVSKAIDRRRYDRGAVLRITCFIRAARDRSGKTNADIDAHFGTNGMAGHWTTQGSQPHVPTLAQWAQLKRFLGFGSEMDAEISRLAERKGKIGEAWEQRAVTGHHHKHAPAVSFDQRGRELSRPSRERRDEPVTLDARRWHGWNTTLKPAHEPIVLARKQFAGSVADNVLQFRTGALNVAACSIPAAQSALSDSGRWPSNVILDEEAARQLDQQASQWKSGPRNANVASTNRGGCAGLKTATSSGARYGDTGDGASRFFYVPRASPSERRAGLNDDAPKHPTMKPVTLMRYLVRLVTPPGGLVLDPFTGSGTTGIAAVLESADFVGIERDPEYIAVADARITHWKGAMRERRAA